MTDAELVAFASDFRSGILGERSSSGRCFMVCAPLVTLLNMYGVECEMVESRVVNGDFYNHFWLKLADGRALDPTADQFRRLGLPAVYLGTPLDDIHFVKEGPNE